VPSLYLVIKPIRYVIQQV